MGESNPELDDLLQQYAQAKQEYDDLNRQIETADEEAKTELRERLRPLDSLLQGLRQEIESKGGTVTPAAPGPSSSSPPQPATQTPSAQPQLTAPPESIDEEWNRLVEQYKQALKDATDHATMQKDD